MSSTESKTRTNILKTTMELMETHSGKGVRMSDIAKAAGVSRQAVYLHFKSRTELMVAAVQYGDKVKGAAERIRPWNEANSGLARLDSYIEFWGGYVPEIYGLAKTMMMALETDEAAAAAWDNRMADVKSGCRTTIEMLADEGMLSAEFSIDSATDLFAMLLSVPNWELLTVKNDWSDEQYISHMQAVARRIFVG